jgi:tetratricopeptide (TPR) repeat protein
LYTPQRLFGEVGSSSDILTHEPFLERARLQRELEQDGSARLALGAYVVARLLDKLLALGNGEGDVEGFRWQLQAVRRHINELPSDAPETAHLAGVVSAIPHHGPPNASLWKSLTAYAYFLEHEGRLEESLEILSLAVWVQGRHLAPLDFAPYALLAGRLNRRLARWESATVCYQAALESASSIGDENRAFRARLGRAHVARALGNFPQARAEVEQVASEAARANMMDVESDAYLDLGVILMLQGARAESLEATYRAFQLCEDQLNRMRILGDLGYGLSESGYLEPARMALEIVVGSDSSYLVRLNALLELMQVESTLGNRVAFERYRNQAKQLGDRMTPSMAVDFRYKLAIGFARFGQRERAREAAREALALAEQHKLNEWYFRLERTLKGFETESDTEVSLEPRAEADAPPSVVRMTTGLKEYAQLSVV